MLRRLVFSEKKRGLQEEVHVRKMLQCLLQCVLQCTLQCLLFSEKKRGLQEEVQGALRKVAGDQRDSAIQFEDFCEVCIC